MSKGGIYAFMSGGCTWAQNMDVGIGGDDWITWMSAVKYQANHNSLVRISTSQLSWSACVLLEKQTQTEY